MTETQPQKGPIETKVMLHARYYGYIALAFFLAFALLVLAVNYLSQYFVTIVAVWFVAFFAGIFFMRRC